MNNYVVIDGDRYDFKDVTKITEDSCSVCALKNFCDYEDTPCSAFNHSYIYAHSGQYAFVKHVKTSNNGKEIIKNKVLTEEELTNVFKYIVKKCDMLINNDHYEADAYTQDTVEDIAELCNHILDGNYGKLVEVKEMDLDEDADNFWGALSSDVRNSIYYNDYYKIAKHFFELGLKVQKGQ